MRRKCALLILLTAACGAGSARETIRPISRASTVLAIYTESSGLSLSPSKKLVVVAWDDGHVLWSGDLSKGGPPYRQAQVDPARLERVVSRLDGDGLFDIADLRDPRFGPDAAVTTIWIKSGPKELALRSWHELIEDNGGIVRKVGAVADERPRLQVLRDEPQDYLFYRFVWAEIRSRALSLIPAAGEPVEGEVVSSSSGLSFREGSAGRH
jgi:hypothetical protein